MRGPGGDAEQRAEVELATDGGAAPGDRIPKERSLRIAGSEPFVPVNRKERRVGAAHRLVVLKEDLQRAQQLKLAVARAVVPIAEDRPEMGLLGRGETRVGRTAFAERPVEEVDKLGLGLGEAGIC